MIKKQKIENSWSDLSSDILLLIMDRLYYTDQIHFRVVCKGWRSKIHGGVKNVDRLPWVLAINAAIKDYVSITSDYVSNTCFCYLYDPTYKKKYRVRNQILIGAELQASKCGWLLLSSKVNPFTTSFCFYCPFTNQIIQLPPLEMKKDYYPDKEKLCRTISSRNYLGLMELTNCFKSKATFSSDPTSSDCVIFVLSTESSRVYEARFTKLLCVSTFRIGDKSWSNAWFTYDDSKVFWQVAYMEGVFYYFNILGADNLIFSYNPESKEHQTYGGNDLKVWWYYLLVESHDDQSQNLLMVSYQRKGFSMYKFDPSRMVGWEVEGLEENRMLFLSSLTSTSLQLPAEEEDVETRGLAGSMHVANYDDCFSQFGKTSGRNESCPQIYGWIHKEGLRNTWIHPPKTRLFDDD